MHKILITIFLFIFLFIQITDNPAFAQKPYTPPHGSPERKAILDALRERIKTFLPEKVNFIVRYLKVKKGWAWIETDPQSFEDDVLFRFEPIDGLLHKEKGKWQVKNIRPCCGDCEEDPYCAKGIYHKKLMKMFPSAPKEIFPKQTR